MYSKNKKVVQGMISDKKKVQMVFLMGLQMHKPTKKLFKWSTGIMEFIPNFNLK